MFLPFLSETYIGLYFSGFSILAITSHFRTPQFLKPSQIDAENQFNHHENLNLRQPHFHSVLHRHQNFPLQSRTGIKNELGEHKNLRNYIRTVFFNFSHQPYPPPPKCLNSQNWIKVEIEFYDIENLQLNAYIKSICGILTVNLLPSYFGYFN